MEKTPNNPVIEPTTEKIWDNKLRKSVDLIKSMTIKNGNRTPKSNKIPPNTI